MSEKKAYRNIHTGKIAHFNDYAYSLVKDSYRLVDQPATHSTTTSTPKKKDEGAAEDDELEKVRGIWRALFNEEPNPRKVIKTLQKEIDEFKSEEK
jgi:hypothetical protein